MKTLLTILAITTLLLSSCKKDKDNDSDTPQPVTSLGATYAGGTVFYLDADGQHGLVVTDDLGEYAWYSGADFAINTTSYEFGEGLNNTNEIIAAQGPGSYAAKVCADLTLNGYTDWYLPSKDELYQINQVDATNIDGEYWCSTESVYPNQTYGWYLQDGPSTPFAQNITGKPSTLKVRAIRNF